MTTARSSLSILALALATGAQADEIRVLNWQGYGTDTSFASEAFQEATGHSVIHEYFNSEQEMLTKLRTNPGAYDVVMINAVFMPQAVREGLVTAIDTAEVPNYTGIPEGFAADPKLMIDGEVYGVPWTWGLTSFAINTSAIPEAPTSIQALWDPAHAGRVSIRDDALEAMQLAALATGQDINEIADLGAAEAKLAELLPQLRTFWSSENDWNQFMAAGELDIATYWSGSAARSAALGLPVEFVVPEEGAIGWLDSLAVPASSSHQEAALAFIDWMIDPAFYVQWDAEGAPASANADAAAALPEDAFNRRVLGDPEVAARVRFQGELSDETRETYLRIWQGLKAAQ
ncbi:ABC transporter substrate-binding protein [Paracoccus tibetensis]|uniref:Spermidine/putrescine transport system substrate-binding protein n=1 Tax=Paracoccus tibetensis TaxID=336292 RepID=A0A1G5JL25_9RHOB|nr:extracellular solute-binding protein [Paracoccus tibetensis]SCY88590.1 spermidine/putrescine transport system substrate-binding protein [Paracoccus tibetensis]